MHQTEKANQWHFGMKLLLDMIHNVCFTAANVHDSQQIGGLCGNEYLRQR